MKRNILLVTLFLFATAAQAGLYRSIDKDGRVIYSDKPVQGVEDVAEVKVSGQADQDEYLPYETKRAQKNFPVTLYVFESCGTLCAEARNLLAKRGIPFTERNLKTQKDLDEYLKQYGSNDLPALVVGKNRLRGFAAAQWHQELDAAGYPKTAPYRAPKPAAATKPVAEPAAESAPEPEIMPETPIEETTNSEEPAPQEEPIAEPEQE